MNVQIRVQILRTMRTLIAHPHMYQKKIALEIAAKNCKCKRALIVSVIKGIMSQTFQFFTHTLWENFGAIV